MFPMVCADKPMAFFKILGAQTWGTLELANLKTSPSTDRVIGQLRNRVIWVIEERLSNAKRSSAITQLPDYAITQSFFGGTVRPNTETEPAPAIFTLGSSGCGK